MHGNNLWLILGHYRNKCIKCRVLKICKENENKIRKILLEVRMNFSGHHLGGSHARRHQDRGEEGPEPQGEDLPQGNGVTVLEDLFIPEKDLYPHPSLKRVRIRSYV